MHKKLLTPYRRVMSALRGDIPEKTPFTIYDIMLPRSTYERDLRNRGICLVRLISTHKINYSNVTIKSIRFTNSDGKENIRTIYSTPLGDLTTLQGLSEYANDWPLEHMFKSPDDYKRLHFLLKNTVITPDYDNAAKAVERLGEDYLVRGQIGLEPLQALVSSIFMSAEDFCLEWMENRDELLKLYNVILENNRKIYSVEADGPLEVINYGGNVVPQIIGVDTFRKYYVPNYNEAAEVLHKRGKLAGCHLDADNTIIMDDIASTDLDYIEAYDAGMSPPVSEARKKWPNKVLWLNWPSAWHMEPVDVVRSRTVQLIKEAFPGNGFIIGITEDMPEERIVGNLAAIMDGIDDYHDCKNK